MTAVVEVDDPLVEQIARAIAIGAAEKWGLQFGADHGFVAVEKERVTPAVRAAVAYLKDAGRLLPEGVTRREVHSRFDGKVREVLEDSPALSRLGTPRVGAGWWIERHIVWETTPARPEATT